MTELLELEEDRIEKLRFIQSMLGEMRTMAEAERCDMLTYLIEMAYIEASDVVRAKSSELMAGDERNAVA